MAKMPGTFVFDRDSNFKLPRPSRYRAKSKQNGNLRDFVDEGNDSGISVDMGTDSPLPSFHQTSKTPTTGLKLENMDESGVETDSSVDNDRDGSEFVETLSSRRYNRVDSAVLVLLCSILSLLMISFVFPFRLMEHVQRQSLVQHVSMRQSEDDMQLIFGQYMVLKLFALLTALIISLVLGLSCCWFSWNITSNDSLDPGRKPPSPISPQPLRKISGHNYHLCYTMSLLNGLVMFGYSIWWQRGKFLA